MSESREHLRAALEAIVRREQSLHPCRCKPDGCGECAECIAIDALRAAGGPRPSNQWPQITEEDAQRAKAYCDTYMEASHDYVGKSEVERHLRAHCYGLRAAACLANAPQVSQRYVA